MEGKKKLLIVDWLLNWLCAWVDMLCGMICVVTLTAYRPWWDFSFRAWSSKKVLKRNESVKP